MPSEHGPYPKDLMSKMNEKNFPSDLLPFISLILKGEFKDEGGFLFKIKEGHSPNLSLLSPREVEIMERQAEIWRDAKGKDIEQWSHTMGSPWRIVWEKEKRKYDVISASYAIDKESPITKQEAENILKEETEVEATSFQ